MSLKALVMMMTMMMMTVTMIVMMMIVMMMIVMMMMIHRKKMRKRSHSVTQANVSLWLEGLAAFQISPYRKWCKQYNSE